MTTDWGKLDNVARVGHIYLPFSLSSVLRNIRRAINYCLTVYGSFTNGIMELIGGKFCTSMVCLMGGGVIVYSGSRANRSLSRASAFLEIIP